MTRNVVIGTYELLLFANGEKQWRSSRFSICFNINSTQSFCDITVRNMCNMLLLVWRHDIVCRLKRDTFACQKLSMVWVKSTTYYHVKSKLAASTDITHSPLSFSVMSKGWILVSTTTWLTNPYKNLPFIALVLFKCIASLYPSVPSSREQLCGRCNRSTDTVSIWNERIIIFSECWREVLPGYTSADSLCIVERRHDFSKIVNQ